MQPKLSSTIWLVVLLFACGSENRDQREIIRPVRHQRVVLSGGEQSKILSGTSKAGTTSKLSFRVGGIVDGVDVKVGEKVHEGKRLASIDRSDAQLNYEKALEMLRKAETQKDIARSNLDRVKELYENNNISLSEYEAAKDKYASANSAHNTERRNADLKKRELGYYALYAPIDGIISEVVIEKNEQVSPGQVVMTIASKEDIEVSIGMPEAFIFRIEAGEKVSVKFSSLPDKIFDGTISEVSFAPDAQSSVYPVIVTVEHPTSDIRPGMAADVTFHFSTRNRASTARLIAPVSAVGKDESGTFVFVLMERENGLAITHKQKVTVGELSHEGFEILEGLQNGALVATAGVGSLADGITVKLMK